jgi:hypothetical protein
MEKSGILNSLPYVSSILVRTSCSEAMEDSEVDEGDWRGLSKGEPETEEGIDESVVGLRCSATRLGRAVDDMVKTIK